MKLIIQETPTEVADYVAKYVIDKINAAKPTAEKPYILGLPTGSSPVQVYQRLIEHHKAGTVSFKNVITFNMDEYVGLPEDHPQSYHSFMKHNLFDHIDINLANVNILNGNATDLQKECEEYEAKIKSVGGVDLFLGGIGTDGHIAFNEPGSSLSSTTRIKTLADDTIIANARFFDGDVKKVPRMALTVGVATVMAAKEVVIIITGAHKAFALYKAVEEEATGELRVKTVKYFKGLKSTW
ncbi:glucosamine-6-phosphate deaminase [Planoprotostelium fungivorum]|uniref:Glucosamine-6-phosphate isomerase n=1 Tax=Planoprotostelium fungivorum TaxID=1890364 RepID=A0A2P6N3R2_9EUKA|nr:glucosamine-6-phosphate deaminase [Planoprotostelium fungivorum]